GDTGVLVMHTLEAQHAIQLQPWAFHVPASTFYDYDGDVLTYSATLADGSALPAWLTFDPTTQNFFGTPPAPAGVLNVRPPASDGTLPVATTFKLAVTDAAHDDGFKDVLLRNKDGTTVLWK